MKKDKMDFKISFIDTNGLTLAQRETLNGILDPKTADPLLLPKYNHLPEVNLFSPLISTEITLNVHAKAFEPQRAIKMNDNKLSYAAILKGKNSNAKSAPLALEVNDVHNAVKQPALTNGKSYTKESQKKVSKISSLLENYVPGLSSPQLLPRGLLNKSNNCYINATLQAIMVCPQVYHLLKQLSEIQDESFSKLPVTSALTAFLKEFDKSANEDVRPPFEAKSIHEVLSLLKVRLTQGQQEDAGEFLAALLAVLNDELGQYSSTGSAPEKNETEDDWQVVSNKKKNAAKKYGSPIEAIFQGLTKRTLCIGNTSRGVPDSYVDLKLDIESENVNSIEDALRQLIKKEVLTDYKSKTKQETTSYYTMERTPDALIVYLKRFIPGKDAYKKSCKEVKFPVDLDIPNEILSKEKQFRPRDTEYRLVSVIYHEGLEITKGHYIADVYNHHLSSWIRCNDAVVSEIKAETIHEYTPSRVPYILFYIKRHLLAKL